MRRPHNYPSPQSYSAGSADMRRGQGAKFQVNGDGRTVLESPTQPLDDVDGVLQFDALSGEIATLLPREPTKVVEIELVDIGTATLPVPAETFVSFVTDTVNFPAGSFRLIGPGAGGDGPIILKTAEEITVDPASTAEGRIHISARFEVAPSRQFVPGG